MNTIIKYDKSNVNPNFVSEYGYVDKTFENLLQNHRKQTEEYRHM